MGGFTAISNPRCSGKVYSSENAGLAIEAVCLPAIEKQKYYSFSKKQMLPIGYLCLGELIAGYRCCRIGMVPGIDQRGKF
jgi:hypothetical protein